VREGGALRAGAARGGLAAGLGAAPRLRRRRHGRVPPRGARRQAKGTVLLVQPHYLTRVESTLDFSSWFQLFNSRFQLLVSALAVHVCPCIKVSASGKVLECLKSNLGLKTIGDPECKREVEKKMVAAAADIRQAWSLTFVSH